MACAHIIEIRRRVVAEAALRRPAGDIVLDAVSPEDLDAAIVERDRKVDGPFALWDPEDLSDPGLELKVIGGLVELRQSRGERAGTTGYDGRLKGLLHRWSPVCDTARRHICEGAGK